MALGFGPMKTMPALAERDRERLALGQEAVARMHRLGAGLPAGGDDLVDQQIALRRGRRADMHGLVRHLDVQRVAVGVGIDRDRLDPHPAGGLDDAAGDLAAIGDQDVLEHARSDAAFPAFWLSGVASPMLPAAAGLRQWRSSGQAHVFGNISAFNVGCTMILYVMRSLPGSGIAC